MKNNSEGWLKTILAGCFVLMAGLAFAVPTGFAVAAQDPNAPGSAEVGKGTEAFKAGNTDEALKWFKAAADLGNPQGEVVMGVVYRNGKPVSQDYVKARDYFQKAADQGFPEGEKLLGELYENGQGVTQSDQEAQKWYQKAADQGDDRAEDMLVAVQDKPSETAALADLKAGDAAYAKKDYATAKRLYKFAARQGNADAQVRLGWIYERKQGIPDDQQIDQFGMAKNYYLKAADQGNIEGKVYAGVLEDKLTNDLFDVISNDPKALAAMPVYILRAAAKDDVYSEINLGWIYAHGVGVEKDLKKAEMYYASAADKTKIFMDVDDAAYQAAFLGKTKLKELQDKEQAQ